MSTHIFDCKYSSVCAAYNLKWASLIAPTDVTSIESIKIAAALNYKSFEQRKKEANWELYSGKINTLFLPN
jgi:hypothetical protein